jgi:hypothetical protein
VSDATRRCGSVQSVTAELRISGRAGNQPLRGTVIVGAARPDALRLEGLAPFGTLAFILVSQAGRTTFLLPRDNRVLTGASADQIVDALTGVSFTPVELTTILAGCGFAAADIGNGRGYPDGWAVADVPHGRLYLRRMNSRWRVVAAVRADLSIEYSELDGSGPRTVRIARGAGDRPGSDLVVRVSQLAIDARLDASAFIVKVPVDAVPLTLEELRQSGPLGAR